MVCYDLKKVMSIYVKGYMSFVKERDVPDENREELYDLFSYSLKKLYEFAPVEDNSLINRYSKSCIAYLRKLKGVPKRYSKLDMSVRVSIISMCQSYFVASGLLFDNVEGCNYDKESLRGLSLQL